MSDISLAEFEKRVGAILPQCWSVSCKIWHFTHSDPHRRVVTFEVYDRHFNRCHEAHTLAALAAEIEANYNVGGDAQPDAFMAHADQSNQS